jgi:hypothetical protein
MQLNEGFLLGQFVRTACCVIVATAVAAPSARAVNVRSGVPEGPLAVRLEIVTQYNPSPSTEFTPIAIAPFNDGTGRLAASTVMGTIRVLDANGQLLPTPLLTNSQSGLVLPQEAGMTGLAFHPDFNRVGTFGYGKLYTITTEAKETAGGLPDALVDFPSPTEEHQDVVREWNLATFGNVPGNLGNGQFTGTLANSRELLRVDQPGPFHNVADLAFNTHAARSDPDYGNLYITSGDGGNHSGYNRFLSAQDLSTVFGNVLRINPDPLANPLQRISNHSGQPAYSIPSDNPWALDDVQETTASATLAEIWAQGFRSPYRISFDRATGDLYIGDVGENAREEVNRVLRGQNYGWGHVEGTVDVSNSLNPSDGLALAVANGFLPPLVELSHSTQSNSIVGGFVYRGDDIPSLKGKYVFADLGQGFRYGSTNTQVAALFYAIVDPNDPAGAVGQVFEFQFDAASDAFDGVPLPERIFAFGEDEHGELYFTAGPDPRNNIGAPSAYFVKLRPVAVLNGIVGDVNQDGFVDPVLDVAQFVAGWKTTGHSGEFDRYIHGDLNFDGATNLADAFLLHQALAAVGSAFPFAALFEVPEPSSIRVVAAAVATAVLTRRRTQGKRSFIV